MRNANKVLHPLKLAALLALSMLAARGLLRGAAQETVTKFYEQGNGLYDQDHFHEAVAAYTRCLDADLKYAPAYFNRALANEMIDRAQSLADWKRFVEVAGDDPKYRWQVGQARAQLQILASLPALPAALQPSAYVESAGDYYQRVVMGSAEVLWKKYPLTFFMGSAPQLKWQQGAREAFDIWSKVIPLQLVALPDEADIRMGWEEAPEEAEHSGEESDRVLYRHEGSELAGRRVAIITVDLSRNWSKDEMRAIVLHELGHALGIKGHSDNKDDLMFWRMKETTHRVRTPYHPIIWKSLVKQPSQRDINTLIRLYNSAGYVARMP
jgi:predicted Zn-dependent protease